MIGRLHGIVIDCPDPSALAAFYEKLLGMVRVQDEGDWVVIGISADQPGLAFARAADFAAPTWPAPEVQQQMHFDVMVPDLDEAERAAVALGARRLPGGADIFRVFADPAGHPFCLCLEP
jgi:catechol 2,3-dioxygenase-like lactoylglutathione lyase family enzyme